VGALAAQMRGYESVRSFLTTLTSQLMVDAPFALLFLLLIGLISGILALIPLAFFALSVAIGLYYRARVEAFARQATAAGNRKTGLLVEAVEGAETIKSGQGGWRMLSQWMRTTDEARDYEMQTRAIQEHAQHLMGSFQQISYILMVATGALLVSKGELTMGSLIACSILSGRVLSPAGMIPNQLVQWANTKAALIGLDRLWALQDDHHGIAQPLVPASVQGRYRFEEVSSAYGGNKALEIKSLHIQAGEKIGVIGPIGGGKTTLLRLLSGMYKPQGGRVLLDDMELSHISKPLLAEKIGYLQQDGRLFAGTLRDNLVLGMLDPGDTAILEAVRKAIPDSVEMMADANEKCTALEARRLVACAADCGALFVEEPLPADDLAGFRQLAAA
jgi:ATP-binding cassette subfamily C protein LapB